MSRHPKFDHVVKDREFWSTIVSVILDLNRLVGKLSGWLAPWAPLTYRRFLLLQVN